MILHYLQQSHCPTQFSPFPDAMMMSVSPAIPFPLRIDTDVRTFATNGTGRYAQYGFDWLLEVSLSGTIRG